MLAADGQTRHSVVWADSSQCSLVVLMVGSHLVLNWHLSDEPDELL